LILEKTWNFRSSGIVANYLLKQKVLREWKFKVKTQIGHLHAKEKRQHFFPAENSFKERNLQW